MKNRIIESFEEFTSKRNNFVNEDVDILSLFKNSRREIQKGDMFKFFKTMEEAHKYWRFVMVYLNLPQNANLKNDPIFQNFIDQTTEVEIRIGRIYSERKSKGFKWEDVYNLLDGWNFVGDMDITSKYGNFKNVKIFKDNPLLNTKEVKTLISFIDCPMSNTDEIIEKFKSLNGAIFKQGSNPKKRFVYVEGTRPDKVLLVAHADTIFDYHHILQNVDETHAPYFDGESFRSTGDHSIGADDRCGVAMCWLLKDSGHSILIVDGEEPGNLGSLIGSQYLETENTDLLKQINENHTFMVQFDRRNYGEYKTYNIGTVEFDKYIESSLGLFKPDSFAFTDICALSKRICGVNLSVGYYGEHTDEEKCVVKEWYDSFKKYEQWLLNSKFETFLRKGYKEGLDYSQFASDFDEEDVNDTSWNVLKDKYDEEDIEWEVIDFLYDCEYEVKDYILGIAHPFDNPRREMKIGKLLQKLGNEELLKKFNTDPIRNFKNRM